MNNLKDKIISNIKVAQEKGITLISEDWGSDPTKCTCALGCVLVANGYAISSEVDDNMDSVSEILGVSNGWISNFIYGFDGDQSGGDDANYEDAWELGAAIRRETNPTPHTDYINNLDSMAIEFIGAMEVE